MTATQSVPPPARVARPLYLIGASIAGACWLVGCGGRMELGDPDPGADAGSSDAPATAPADSGSLLAIVTGRDPFAVAVDDNFVYWAEARGDVLKCPKAGCTEHPVQLASGQGDIGPLVAANGALYWGIVGGSLGGAIMTCATAACTSHGLLPPGSDEPLYLAVLDGNMFWMTNTGKVMTCPTSDCAAPIVLASDQLGGAGISVDDTNVYWEGNDAVMMCARTGCGGSPQPVAVSQSFTGGLAADATDLYWAVTVASPNYPPPQELRGCSKFGCKTPLTLTQFNGNAFALLVDDTNVYWGNYAANTVSRCAKAGCGNSELVAQAHLLGGLAQDASRLFWTDQNTCFTDASCYNGGVYSTVK